MIRTSVFLPALLLAVALDCAAQALPNGLSETDVLARLGSAAMTVAELDAHYLTLPRVVRDGWLENPRMIGDALTNLLLRRVIALDLESPGDPRLRRAKRVAREAEREVLVDLWLQWKMDRMPQPDLDALARAAYAARAGKLRRPRTVDVRHLLIPAGAIGDGDAMALARVARSELIGDPQAFGERIEAALAAEDARLTGGNVSGLVAGREDVAPEFLEAALALTEVGEISPPVRTRFGVHLIQLTGQTPAGMVPFEDVYERFRREAAADYARRTREDLLDAEGNDRRRIARLAREAGLDQRPRHQARIRQAIDEALILAYKAQLFEEAKLDTESLAREQYRARPEDYRLPASFSGRIALFEGGPESAGLDAEARNTLESLVDRSAPCVGACFDDILDRLSPSYVRSFEGAHERMLPTPLARSLAASPPSGPTLRLSPSEENLYVVELTAYAPPVQQSFEAVRATLESTLRSNLENKLWDDFVARYRQLPLAAEKERIASLHARYLAGIPSEIEYGGAPSP